MQAINAIVIPRGRILDPFAGSGSTGIAALRDGRTFVGIELSDRIARQAVERIEADLQLTTRHASNAGQLGLFAEATPPAEDDFG